ncbi:unnamed protein product [Absidia cylindrospora]
MKMGYQCSHGFLHHTVKSMISGTKIAEKNQLLNKANIVISFCTSISFIRVGVDRQSIQITSTCIEANHHFRRLDTPSFRNRTFWPRLPRYPRTGNHQHLFNITVGGDGYSTKSG